jgi:hypothetical protein
MVVLCILTMSPNTTSANDAASLGYCEDTFIESDGRDCAGVLLCNHDFSFENAYCWQYEGAAPPYYGAFAEGYEVGGRSVECGIYWLTTLGWYPDPMDVYVWSGGVDGPPGGVLCMIPGVGPLNVGYWPACAENEIEMHCCSSGEVAVGFWSNNAGEQCTFYCCADESGTPGHPWTCIAPGIGYPTGWQHPSVVFPGCSSMGIGITVTEDPSPVESNTWGEIKSLYRK